jgi:hypothetical protein
MVSVMPPSHHNILGIQGTGKLTEADYQDVLIPQLEGVLKKYPKARFLYYLDEGFTGWEMGAMWEDAKFGLRHKDDFEKIAVVGGAQVGGLGNQSVQIFYGGSGQGFPPGAIAGGLGLAGVLAIGRESGAPPAFGVF